MGQQTVVDSRPTTIVIYVLHHPESAEAAGLAQQLYTYFRRPSREVFRSRIGLAVYVRSATFPDEQTAFQRESFLEAGGLRLRHCGDEPTGARLTFVIPLIDATMVADGRWGQLINVFLGKLTTKDRLITPENERDSAAPDSKDLVRVIPVSLHGSAAHLHTDLAVTQGVSASRWTDDALSPEQRAQKQVSRIKRELALAMIRTVRWCITGKHELEPVQIFLSHAKRDREAGPGVAEKLRDTIASMGHLRAWYDETDLLPGSAWMKRLKNAGPASDGMIICLSDNYADRPWCRAEVRSARKPWPIAKGSSVWTNCPAVVIDLLGARSPALWTQTLGELGEVPVVRWDEQRAEEVVDRVIRECLMSVANALHATSVVQKDELAVTWNPDAATISEVVASVSPGDRENKVIRHPGYGVTSLPASLGKFKAFDEVKYKPPGDTRKQVQLSLSDGGSDLAQLGMLRDHVAELAFDLATGVLAAGHDLIYGGTPAARAGEREGIDLVDEVLNAARVANDVAAETAAGTTDHAEATRRLQRVTLLEPWRGRQLTAEERVAHLPFAVVEQILPPRPAGAPHGRWPSTHPEHLPRLLADALSAMRKRAAELADVVVIAGGKDIGFTGYLPGVLEELMCAVEASKEDGKQRQILVLGGFGGAARHIARRIDARLRNEPFSSDWWDPKWHVQRSPHQLGVLWQANPDEIGKLWERAGHAVDVVAQQYTNSAWLLRADGTRRLRGVVRKVLEGDLSAGNPQSPMRD